MALPTTINRRKYKSYQKDNETLTETAPVNIVLGTVCRGDIPTSAYTSGDSSILHTDTDGFLLTRSKSTPTVTSATGALAISTSTTIANNFRLVSVTVHLSAAPVTSEDLTVKLNAKDGAAYDTVLFSVDPSATSATDIVYIPDRELLFESGDEIDVAYANTDANTYGLRIVTQVV